MPRAIRKGAGEDEASASEEVGKSASSDDARQGNDASMFPTAPSESTGMPEASQGTLHKLPGFSPSVTVNETLVWTNDTVYVLANDSWVVRANEVLSESTPDASDKAAKIVEEERKRAKRGEVDGDKVRFTIVLSTRPQPGLTRLRTQASHTADLRFMYARLAYKRLQAALFDDAGSLFQKSKIDPRFVISLFPRFVGNSIPQDQELVIWRGLVSSLDEIGTIDEIGK